MTVLNKDTGANQIELWFSNKPGQKVGESDVERYAYCSNPGNEPWLFLIEYVNAKQDKLGPIHPVQSTRILFTPDQGHTVDLIADGTYAQCGNKGQPYLLWNQKLDKYRIQVWGFLTKNPKRKWYWDATVYKPSPVAVSCLKSAGPIKAIKVQEAWWSNFSVPMGTWSLGAGDLGGEGLPTGGNVVYGRSVWHAQGQIPYFLTGGPDGRSITWCVNDIAVNAP